MRIASELFDRAASLLDGQRNLLIDGEWVASTSEADTVVDPSTGLNVGAVAVAGKHEVGQAVKSAAKAASTWSAIGPYARQRALEELATAIEARAEDLAQLDALDSGNPVTAMRNDVREGVKQMRFLAAVGLSLHGRTQPATAGELHYSVLEPYGVVARIIPFNHPAMFAVSKLAAPLIAGNAVVLKPPEQAPLSAILLGQIIQETLPPGVVNIVTGGAQTGNELVTHPTVKRVAFTGSVGTGRAIQRAAADVGVKHVTLELGGKNAMIVLPDADLTKSVRGAIQGMNLLVCQGQSCGSNSRILVHRDVRDEFCQELTRALSEIRVGVAYEEESQMGPLVSQEQYERVNGFLSSARDDGIRFGFGGGRPDTLEHDGGFFVAPTLLLDVPPESTVAREEIFGPVISLMPWSDLHDAVSLANDVEYGLTGSVWTQDVNTAHLVAHQLDVGYVWINQHGPHYVGTPFGGKKSSGIGREESIEEVMSYCEEKSVHVSFG